MCSNRRELTPNYWRDDGVPKNWMSKKEIYTEHGDY
jgi:hypothetical protein